MQIVTHGQEKLNIALGTVQNESLDTHAIHQHISFPLFATMT